MQHVVVVDLETTGKYPQRDAITEIAARRLPVTWFEDESLHMSAGDTTNTFTTLVNPERPIPALVEELTGISDDLVADAPVLTAVLPKLLDFCEGAIVVAHNAVFDLSFLAAASQRQGLTSRTVSYLDTLKMSRKVLGRAMQNHRLATLAAHYQTPSAPTHRALADVHATAHVLKGLVKDADDLSGTDGELTLFDARPSWAAALPFVQVLPRLENILKDARP